MIYDICTCIIYIEIKICNIYIIYINYINMIDTLILSHVFPWPPNYRYPSLPNDYPPCPAAQLGTCALSLRNLHGNLKKKP